MSYTNATPAGGNGGGQGIAHSFVEKRHQDSHNAPQAQAQSTKTRRRTKATVAEQLELFGQRDLFSDADPLWGLQAYMPRPCSCGHDLFQMGVGRGPHRVSLYCTKCEGYGGDLANAAARFLAAVICRFGRLTEPVVVACNGHVDSITVDDPLQKGCSK